MASALYLRLLLGILFPTITAGLAVMSVDFGGEFMKIAIVKPGVPMEIVLNKESQRKTPAAISLRNDERVFGDAALSAALRYPKASYRHLHEVLGKDFDNPLVTEFRRKHPFYEMEKDPATGSVLFKHDENTKYSPEELIAMILQKAKEYAEAFAEQPISEAVITVPAFYNQAERRAMLRAGELAGLKVLQLISDNAAVALNYGIFRRKSFNSTPVYYMFSDIGASSMTTTIVEYQVVKVKSPTSGLTDTFPQLTIKGVGFDRTLGGTELQGRLRDHLAKNFNSVRKVKKDVFEDNKAMQKLFKEAGRVKQVLSANVDHYAQVEGLADDEDFRVKVTREEFEQLCSDLFERVGKTVKQALDSAQMTMAEISEVILMGAGTRMPKIQEVLKKAIGREELGKGINTDEAAALGAVYQAAHLGKGFKVQKFGIREATIYPIQVDFERVRLPGDSDEATKIVKRTLFGYMQTFPQKKVMTFNKHNKDFAFQINYGDLSFLQDGEMKELGSTSLAAVALNGVEEAFSKHPSDEVSRGIKAHFRLDESGLLYVDRVEATFEKTAPAVETEEESTLAKLGKSFSNFFGGSPKVDEAAKEGTVKDEEGSEKNVAEEATDDKNVADENPKRDDQEDAPEDAPENKTEEKEEETAETKQDDATKFQDEGKETAPEKGDEEKKTEESAKDEKTQKPTDDAAKTEEKQAKVEKKPQVLLLKEPIKVDVEVKDLKDPDNEKMKLAKKYLEDFKKRDDEKDKLERSKNDIESFVFDTRDKLEQEDYIKCSTEKERLKISEALEAASDWLYEQEEGTPRKAFESKLKELVDATRDVFERVYELRERPAFVETLNDRLNHSRYFLAGMVNFTGEDQPFTQVEYDTLKDLIKDIKDWNKTVHQDQKKSPPTEKPKFTVEDIIGKINSLDREIKYLINKVKSFKPKSKDKEAKNETAGESTAPEKENASEDGKGKEDDEATVAEDDDDLGATKEESTTQKQKTEATKEKKKPENHDGQEL